MLYLVRKRDESVIINGDIEIKVIEIKGRSVKLGFEFPKTATVLRKEIHDRVVEENIAAAALASGNDGLDSVDLANALGTISDKKDGGTPADGD
ncbi:MAG: carbon storage regulator [Planctomycetes bacterium]|nr:carbon storage regulator [Planctomycetota bacterium]